MAVSAVRKEAPKAAQAAPAAAAAPAAEAPAGKKKSKLLFILLAIFALCGGGAAWWFIGRDSGTGTGTAKQQPAKPPVFAPLEAFTVNLQAEEGSQFLQVGLTLRLTDEPAVAALKLRMPEVRDRILLLLSSKKASELLTLDGKRKLSSEIQSAVNAILVPGSEQAAAAAAAPAAPAAPAPAAAAPAEGAAAPADPAAAQEPAPAETEAAQAEPAAPLPVTGVLFTSFIIQ